MAPPVSTSTRLFGVIAIAAIGIVFNAGIAAIRIVFAGIISGIISAILGIVFAGIVFIFAIAAISIVFAGIIFAIAAISVFADIVVSAGITTAALADILSIITFAITITLRFLLVVHEGCLSDCVLAPFFLYPGQGKKERFVVVVVHGQRDSNDCGRGRAPGRPSSCS